MDPQDAAALARRLGSNKRKGRVLQAVGWHDFKPNLAVGALLIHVDPSKPLRITRVLVIDGLPGYEQQEVRTALHACAAEVAVEMKRKGVGNGCLDWEISADSKGSLLRVYPDFQKAPTAQQPRGKRSLLQKCPDDTRKAETRS